MRVSTAMLFDTGVATMQRQTASALQTQQQVATGRRILTPSDDPVAAARTLEVTQVREINAQYGANRDNARTALGLVESQLTAVGHLIQNVRERSVQLGDPVLSLSDRQSIARELRARFDELMGLANATDGAGLYLFSGYQGATRPFAGSVEGGVTYAGDDGQRQLQVASSRQMPVSDSGADVFLRIRNGNGSFVTGFGAANAGTGLIAGSNVLTAYNGQAYTIGFSATPTGLDYTVTNTTTATVAATGTYASGEAIAFDGISITITEAPAAGDTFSIAPSTSQSIFETISALVLAAEDASGDPGAGARLSNAVGLALTNLSQSEDVLLSVRASVGSRLAEVDALSSVGEDLNIQYESTLSRLQDVDFAEAITRLERQRLELEAAQRSFLRVSDLSLFRFL